MNSLNKLALMGVAAVAVVAMLVLPGIALGQEPGTMVSPAPVADVTGSGVAAAEVITGDDITISGFRGASPAIDISSDGSFIAVAYYKDDGNGGIHLKSANGDPNGGWVTTRYLGNGENPRVAFSNSNSPYRVFVVWEAEDNSAIRFANCTLNLDTQPTCNDTSNVVSGVTNAETPDITVDGSGNLQVVWIENNNVRSASSANNGGSWSASFLVDDADAQNNFRTPQIAATSGALHVAVSRLNNSTNLGDAINYYKTTNLTSHSWPANPSETYRLGSEIDNQYNDLANPTLDAAATAVHLAWEAQTDAFPGANNDFGLIHVTSTDQGDNWDAPVHTTGTQNPAVNLQDPPIASKKAVAVPAQEAGLQPSLTISSTGFALVWQQRPLGGTIGCQEDGNATSEIYYTTDAARSDTDMVADDESQYSIDPDLSVDGSGTRHFVFMKDDDANQQTTGEDTSCDGGEIVDYKVFYRGPFIVTKNDQGEDPTDPDVGPPTVYLPIISKS